MMCSYIGSSLENTIQAVIALYICQAHTSVLLFSKEADSEQDSPNPVSIPIKYYLSLERKRTGKFPQLRNNLQSDF